MNAKEEGAKTHQTCSPPPLIDQQRQRTVLGSINTVKTLFLYGSG